MNTEVKACMVHVRDVDVCMVALASICVLRQTARETSSSASKSESSRRRLSSNSINDQVPRDMRALMLDGLIVLTNASLKLAHG